MSRFFLLAGEASGDLHGALLAAALKRRDSAVELYGVGGPEMARAGVQLVLDSRELAVVGLFEVISRLPAVLDAYERVQQALLELKPDLFIPIDFPDFNFRLLPKARRLGLRSLWYISPQVWAWRAERVEVLRRYVERIVVIFPFEEAFYRARGVAVDWVGHPLLERVTPLDPASRNERRRALGLDGEGPVIALLPGSRRSEVTRLAPLLAQARVAVDHARSQRDLPPARWIVGRAEHVDPRWLAPLAGVATIGEELDGRQALELADLALAASGTVTMEAALLGVPTVVVYRTNALTFAIARRLIQVEHIAMANLILGRRLFPELLQDAATPTAIAEEILRLADPGPDRRTLVDGMAEVRARLGPPGAADRAAEVALAVLRG
ncbi:MAG: lipid-A-disaccharide synthase [Candidatus Eisenbacteria bacterium]